MKEKREIFALMLSTMNQRLMEFAAPVVRWNAMAYHVATSSMSSTYCMQKLFPSVVWIAGGLWAQSLHFLQSEKKHV
jgi:hypothetical protein